MREKRKIRIHWTPSILAFGAMHLACVAAFFLPFSGSLAALALGLYLVRMFAITAGYHRYFSHRSFRTSRTFQFVLALLGSTALQKGPLWWAAHHRHHHVHSDEDPDVHSPTVDGFLWSHLGWIVDEVYEETKLDDVPDLARYPELVWLDRWYALPGAALGTGLFLAGGWPAFVWGFCISTVATWHVTFMINSLTHMFGRRRYDTPDNSRNSLILALLTLGEGWHNNHHHYMASTRQGFFWWEIDLSYYALRVLALLGVVWDLREPPAKAVFAHRRRSADELPEPAPAGRPS